MIRVPLENFSDRLGDIRDQTLAVQRRAVVRGMANSIPDLVAASPVDQGFYAASWDMNVTETAATLGNYAPYAGVIEDGARPHVPPIGPLLAWAKRVSGSPSQPPEYDSQVWAMAKAVQRKIAEHGQAPKHILRNMIPQIIENIRSELARG